MLEGVFAFLIKIRNNSKYHKTDVYLRNADERIMSLRNLWLLRAPQNDKLTCILPCTSLKSNIHDSRGRTLVKLTEF
jgi:hypothetical protein